MRNNFKIILFFLFAFISIVSCTNDPLRPAESSNIPSNIIVTEKSISGNFDSLICNLRLFPRADSLFYDSLHVEMPVYSINTTFTFNYSRFATHKFIYIDQILYVSVGDSISTAIFLDDNNRLTSGIGAYAIQYPEPSYQSVGSSYYYDSYGRMNSFNFGNQYDIGICLLIFTGSEGIYYTNSEGNDSLVITTREASCGTCWFCSDSIIVTYLSKPNTTNSLYLSYPTIPSLTTYPSYYNFYMDYISFPKMNGKLIDKVSYFTHNGIRFTYTNTYTYDTEGRIKTAKIYYFDKAREELIEFNY